MQKHLGRKSIRRGSVICIRVEEVRKGLKTSTLKFKSVQKEKNRSLDKLYQNCGSYLVEVRRVELLSENCLPRLSPSAVAVLNLPHRIAQRQARRLGSS